MFNWHKNKKENKPSNSDAQTPVEKSDDVTFHTMQDDLNAPEGIIAGEKWKKTEPKRKKESSRSEVYYDKKVDKAKEEAGFHSPFLSDASAAPKPFTIPPKSSEVAKTINKSKQESLAAISKKHINFRINWGAILKIATFLSVITAIFLGAYLFWISSNQIEVPQMPAAPETQVPAEKIAPVEKYSSETPNYLSIDTESASAEDITQLLIQIASEIKEFQGDGPFEFIVTDANNNPLSFPIFAYLAKLNLSQNVLDSFDESFSLYFYRDSGDARTGLAIDINNKETATLEMAKEENTLAGKLQPLFLGSSFSKINKSFNTSQYKNFSIHYLNLDEQNNLSVDYTTTENQLIIGFSKNTARAIIDRVEQSENLITTLDDEDEESEEENTDDDVDIEL